MSAGHSHGHDHALVRGEGARADRRWLLASLAVILCFMIGEVTVGLAVGSLALLADAGHMLTDAAALALAVITSRVSERPARGAFTFGFTRVDALSAQANGITLLALSVWFVVEGVRRLIDPPDVPGASVLIVAVIGIGMNLLAAVLAGRASRASLNVQGALAHIVNDLWAFVATAVAGLLMLLFGWYRADAIATLIVAGLMIRAGVGLVTAAGRVFLEAAPTGVDPRDIGSEMAEIPGVREIHDLHVWDLGSGEPALSAHVVVSAERDCHEVAADVRTMLTDQHLITHATLQVDHQRQGQASVGDDCVLSHGPGYLNSIDIVDGAVDVGPPQRGIDPASRH